MSDSSKKPWEPEKFVDEGLAIQLVEGQFPELRPLSLQRYGEGWDNVAYLINNAFIFRFPRRQIAVDGLENEIRALPRLATQLQVAVPNPMYVGKATSDFPWPFYGYKKLAGITACRLHLSEQDRSSLAGDLGRFLKTLHALPHSTDYINLPGDLFKRSSLRRRSELAQERLVACVKKGALCSVDDFVKFLRVTSVLELPESSCIAHGDLYARHLLIDDGRLVGIIDWGDVHIGHTVVDLGVAHSFLPGHAHEAFLSAYGEVHPDIWLAARLIGLCYASVLLHYGIEQGDEFLISEAQQSIKFIHQAISE